MSQPGETQYPIENPDELHSLAALIRAEMGGTDDAPKYAISKLAEYPPLYAAAVGIALARLIRRDEGQDSQEWLARFVLAVAQNRVRSVFEHGNEPYWPEWMER